ncbi:MAG: hypothetical protein B6D45_02335 [Ignavibacteriales bacterium UTCHB3]|nr:MAG: hypothetical protein B6D45_02335 [Ignavibacteriales bacterium UTCHB3]
MNISVNSIYTVFLIVEKLTLVYEKLKSIAISVPPIISVVKQGIFFWHEYCFIFSNSLIN